MEINNPQVFDHIIGINGEILQPKVLSYVDVEPEKIHPDTIVWRKTTADEFHVPPALLEIHGTPIEILIVPYGSVNPASIDVTPGYMYTRKNNRYYLPEALVGANTNVMRVKVIEIGVWNMDTTPNKNVVHGLDFAKICSVSTAIINDTSDIICPINRADTITGEHPQGKIGGWDANTVILSRPLNGDFDNGNFDDGVMNRGTVTIWYQD